MATILYFVVFTFILGEFFVDARVRELTDYNFNSVVSSNRAVLVSFYAHWCPHCQRFAPKYQDAALQLARTHPSIPISQIDCAGRGKSTCQRQRIPSYPTVRLFINGRFSRTFNGPMTTAGVLDYIEKLAPRPLRRPPPRIAPSPTRSVPIPPRRVPGPQKVGVRELTDSSFNSVLSSNKAVLVSFYAHWCPHCQRFAPMYEDAALQLARTHPSIPITQIDCAGRGKSTCARQRIRSYPTIRLYIDGRFASVLQFNGPRSMAAVIRFIQEQALRIPQRIAPRIPTPRVPIPTKRVAMPRKIVPASWGMWAAWSRCSVTCGNGFRTRNRACKGYSIADNNSCAGKSTEKESCSMKPCVAAAWSMWNEWTKCSVTCGVGMITRTRTCGSSSAYINNKCVGTFMQEKSCTRKPCAVPAPAPVPVAVAAPVPVKAAVPVPVPVKAAVPVPVPVKVAVPVPVPAAVSVPVPVPKSVSKWGDWGEWTVCPITCGRGSMKRKRVCMGSSCSGNDIETGTCIRKPCPKVASWSKWSGWTLCSVTCGRGKITRSRVCEGSSASKTCSGDKVQTGVCIHRPCSSGVSL